ncbi:MULTISPECIES: DUF6332 family protein [unclassified Streptomyces]|uniref:DUF6332 family protein n=1 Tax=unclassified Streptomyces TaxID=2593676 RepID=UPI00386D50E5
MGRRTQAERDAMTTEIGFAFFAGAVLAGAAYFGVTELLPHFFGSLRGRWSLLGPLALSVTVVVFVAVVTIVLTRFRRATRVSRQVPEEPGRPRSAQPSQPGRTNPDS